MLDLNTLVGLFESLGYIAVFGMLLLCGFGLPVPEDITLVAGGIISGLHYTNVHVMLLVGLAGVLIGDSTMYFLGHHFGERFLKVRFVARILPPQRYTQVQDKFQEYGKWVIFAARFMPGLRSPIFVTAGITRFVKYWQFIAVDGTAALISVPIWVYLGYYGADNREWLMRWITRSQIGFIVLLLAVIIFIVISSLIKHRLKKFTS